MLYLRYFNVSRGCSCGCCNRVSNCRVERVTVKLIDLTADRDQVSVHQSLWCHERERERPILCVIREEYEVLEQRHVTAERWTRVRLRLTFLRRVRV